MDWTFNKYQGAGNDFVVIDDRTGMFPESDVNLVRTLCDRRFGIGGDGLLLIRNEKGYDYRMLYFNSDGNESSMCGNGGRCLAAFAHKLGIIDREARFMAVDGYHQAEILSPDYVRLKMNDVTEIEEGPDFYYLNTGSPHYVTFHPSVNDLDVLEAGKKIRYNERFSRVGTNVDFVQERPRDIFVRTYERGVENETLACGTGVVASAICSGIRKGVDNASFSLPVEAMGGKLKVSFHRKENTVTDIWLEGPATYVFEGRISI